MIEISVTYFILALPLLCEWSYYFLNILLILTIVSFFSYFNKMVCLQLALYHYGNV